MLKSFYNGLPNIVFGLATLIGGLIALTLPETLGVETMNDFETARKFYKNSKNLTSESRNSENKKLVSSWASFRDEFWLTSAKSEQILSKF